MAYNNYTNKLRQQTNQYVRDIQAANVPADYVDAADNVMRSISEEKRSIQITTSKLRNILSLISPIYDRERIRNEAELLPESVTGLQMMRVRVLYEAGRDEKTVKPFVEKAKLLEYIKGIGTSREKCLLFANYMEALVAYHRFYHIGTER